MPHATTKLLQFPSQYGGCCGAVCVRVCGVHTAIMYVPYIYHLK